jgi:signal transduction histidine kinase
VTGAPRRGPSRIALRIWVVTVATVLATAAALWLVLALAHERRHPPLHELLRDVSRYAAGRVASRWPDEAGLRQEVEALAGELRVAVALRRWDGALVASAGGPAPAPPSGGELEALGRAGLLERGGGPPGPRAVAVAVRKDGAPVAVLQVAPPALPGGARPPPPELLALALVLVAVGVAAVLLGGAIARPLDRLARTARALGAGDLSARTGVSRGDEVGAVARAFDEMADRLVGLLRGQTELIANVAHELRTPLSRIRVALDLAADGDAAVARASLAEIEEDLSELEALVSDVLASARMDLAGNVASTAGAPPLRRAPLDLGAVVEQAAERLRHRHPDRRVELTRGPDLPELLGDAVLLRRAIDNLADNARKYSPPASPIRLRVERRGDGAAVEVSDEGEGIAPDDLARLFTPFFRADRSRARATGGVGLGLALAKRIVEAHGGALVARSAPGAGTTMTVTLPGRP